MIAVIYPRSQNHTVQHLFHQTRSCCDHYIPKLNIYDDLFQQTFFVNSVGKLFCFNKQKVVMKMFVSLVFAVEILEMRSFICIHRLKLHVLSEIFERPAEWQSCLGLMQRKDIKM